MRRIGILAAVVLAGILGGSGIGVAQAKVLASQVDGQLVSGPGGAPVAGATIVRRWTWVWNGKSGEDRTTTDAQGRFAFAPVTGRSFSAGLLPHEPSIDQDFIVEFGGGRDPLLILGLQKRNYDENGETGGRPMRIRCRTDLEPEARGFYWGTCELVE